MAQILSPLILGAAGLEEFKMLKQVLAGLLTSLADDLSLSSLPLLLPTRFC